MKKILFAALFFVIFPIGILYLQSWLLWKIPHGPHWWTGPTLVVHLLSNFALFVGSISFGIYQISKKTQ